VIYSSINSGWIAHRRCFLSQNPGKFGGFQKPVGGESRVLPFFGGTLFRKILPPVVGNPGGMLAPPKASLKPGRRLFQGLKKS